MMIGAELFRQGPRPLAMAVAGVVNWLGTFAIAMGFESVQVRFSSLLNSDLLVMSSSYHHSRTVTAAAVNSLSSTRFAGLICLHWALFNFIV